TEVQGNSSWAPPGGTLGTIVEQTMERVITLRIHRRQLEAEAEAQAGAPPFASALRGDTVRVIAELKRRSPSKGAINEALSAPDQAAAYAAGRAAAISVLTEPLHFNGSNADLESVRGRVRIPLLKKDFHVDDVQLFEARALGASAALLIARALDPATLPRLVALAHRVGLETLVEVRSADELARAVDAGASVIGVNCRNLETLEVDPRVAESLVPRVPAGIVAVWESAIASAADVERAARAGADAVLVGSAVSAAANPEQAVRALTQVPRRAGVRG
ncbi:MAG: indole-3-glycerol-phosphate synthase, partial [Gemmatimonadota bacterium]|nr:indole-3-glycerol-phosphate synthase [Gemmatimonadota bacterium]